MYMICRFRKFALGWRVGSADCCDDYALAASRKLVRKPAA
jgi:hypothetical protein